MYGLHLTLSASIHRLNPDLLRNGLIFWVSAQSMVDVLVFGLAFMLHITRIICVCSKGIFTFIKGQVYGSHWATIVI